MEVSEFLYFKLLCLHFCSFVLRSTDHRPLLRGSVPGRRVDAYMYIISYIPPCNLVLFRLDITALFFGLLTIALSYVAPYLGDELIQIPTTIWGSIMAPLFGVFILAMFFPCANASVSDSLSAHLICTNSYSFTNDNKSLPKSCVFDSVSCNNLHTAPYWKFIISLALNACN